MYTKGYSKLKSFFPTIYLVEEYKEENNRSIDRYKYRWCRKMFADTLEDAIAYLDSKKNQDLKLAIINETNNK